MIYNPRTRPVFLPAYALEQVPRYTSYPPATRFHNDIRDADWAGWLSALPKSSTLSLYIHIPFCRSMCFYCACNTTIPNKDERIARYLTALHREIANKAAMSPETGIVRHIHFGGGSPDMLSAKRFAAIIDELHQCFDIAADVEIAVELDPRGLTTELATAMAECGVTRASLGVQDLSDQVQKLINRFQPEAVVQGAVDHLRAAGIRAINMDIMYGLPAQTVERVENTASVVVDMAPDRLAVFGYAHVPWFKKHQKAIPEDQLPGAEERFDQMQAVAGLLLNSGYEAIGFDHFARPDDGLAIAARSGTLRRNFQGYTDDGYGALIGLGASAISDTALGFAQNVPDPTRYTDAILAGRSAIMRGIERSLDDQRMAEMIEQLMCQFEISITPDQAREEGALDSRKDLLLLQRGGLVELDRLTLRVTGPGRPYVRNIAARLDPAFALSGQQQHSQAV